MLPSYAVPVAVDHLPRVNTVVVDSLGVTTNINERPRPLRGAQWAALCRLTLQRARRTGSSWIVIGGSLPTLRETGELVDLAALVRGAAALGVRVCVDAPGEHLTEVLRQCGRIDLVKPNLAELSAAVQTQLRTLGQACAAAVRLREHGVGSVLVSLGQDGVMLVDRYGTVVARAAARRIANTTGAGDAAVAGFIAVDTGFEASNDELAARRLRAAATAASWGALTVETSGTVSTSFENPPTAVFDAFDAEFALSDACDTDTP
jgi:1-phosphofructokinase